MSENDRNVVQVLTAGGAATPRRKRLGDPRSSSHNRRGKAAATTISATPSSQQLHQGKTKNASSATTLTVQNPPEVDLQLELEDSSGHLEHNEEDRAENDMDISKAGRDFRQDSFQDTGSRTSASLLEPFHSNKAETASSKAELIWLLVCFLGIMGSFVVYGLLLEYTTSGGRKLHELSFLFVTSALYTLTAAAGRYVRDETPTTIPPARFAVLGLTSMGSTWCSVRSLRYVIYPIQVLAKSCKPVPVMLFGTLMGKRYPARKYFNVALIVAGVAMFMGGGDSKKKENSSPDDASSTGSPSVLIGILLLFVSLCFDGGTGAYEDKLMSVHSVQPFDLMYNIQLGKTILAGIGLIVFNQFHIFLQMVQDMGFMLVALGLSGALGQVFIFVTIAKFGALTCSIIGLARKITTLVASIYFYGHSLNSIQFVGLVVSVGSMVMNFMGKSKDKGTEGVGHHGPSPAEGSHDELEKMLDDLEGNDHGNVELVSSPQRY